MNKYGKLIVILLALLFATGCLSTGKKKVETIKMPESEINKSEAPEFPDLEGIGPAELKKIQPPAPLNFQGHSKDGDVYLSWKANTNYPPVKKYSDVITSYIVYRHDYISDAKEYEWRRIVQTKIYNNDYSYKDNTTVRGKTYQYKISQVHESTGDRGTEGEQSKPISVKVF